MSINDLPTGAAPGTSVDENSKDGPLANSMSTTASSSAKLSQSTQPDTKTERYVRRSTLGQGGFGCVYEAWDQQLHRTVAIKVDRFGTIEPRSFQKFVEEGRAAAKLNHPNIVKVFDVGIDQDQTPFVVLEYIDGGSLAQRIKTDAKLDEAPPHLPREEVILIMISVADAVQAAHKAGLVHRDLKPANILLDGNGQPHVSDFGLAIDERSQREQKGVVAGSWFYMSPEQIRGETQYLDGRTDIWSLGVILYELLGRRRPFTGPTPADVQDEILNREPKPLRQIDDSIPIALEQICFRCLSKSIRDRYSSAAELANVLRAFQKRPAWQSNQRIVAIVISLLILVTFGFGAYSIASKPTIDAKTPQARVSQPKGEPSSHGGIDMERNPVVHRPRIGKWFTLLRERPEALHWPADQRNSHWEFIPEDQELWVTSSSRALLKLGAVDDGDYGIQLTLHQSPWVGNVGIFLGGHLVDFNGIPCKRYQLVLIHCDFADGIPKASLRRMILQLDDQDGQKVYSNLGSMPLPDLSLREQSLRISIQNRRLVLVEWNQIAIRELADSDDGARVLMPDDAHGDFGVYVAKANAVFRRPELLLIEE